MTKEDLSRLIVFMFTMKTIERSADIICPATVATAAPIIPILKTKIKIGSRIMLAIAPDRSTKSAFSGFPSDRIIGFTPCANI